MRPSKHFEFENPGLSKAIQKNFRKNFTPLEIAVEGITSKAEACRDLVVLGTTA